MARFDPRGQLSQQPQSQQSQQSQQSSVMGTSSQQSIQSSTAGLSVNLGSTTTSSAQQAQYAQFSHGQAGHGQPQTGGPLSSISAPSPVQTPPPLAQRSGYNVAIGQSSAPQNTPSAASSGHAATALELSQQSQGYRQPVSSPTIRNSSISYGSRPGPALGSSQSSLLGIASRPTTNSASFGSPQLATASSHIGRPPPSNSHQTYQHIHGLINGSHQQQPAQSHRASLGLGGSPSTAHYSHNSPPTSRTGSSAQGPSSLAASSLGRSFTPPAVLQPHPTSTGLTSGLGYSVGRPSGVTGPAAHSLQPRNSSVSGPLAESSSPASYGRPGHHRGYSQGSNTAAGQQSPH